MLYRCVFISIIKGMVTTSKKLQKLSHVITTGGVTMLIVLRIMITNIGTLLLSYYCDNNANDMSGNTNYDAKEGILLFHKLPQSK